MSEWADFTTGPAATSGKLAFERAGIRPDEIDLACIYDAFTFMETGTIEHLGFCAKGEGGDFVADGRIRFGGDLPVNPDGGGLSACHPGMRGLFLPVEATRQLRGDYADGKASTYDGVPIPLNAKYPTPNLPPSAEPAVGSAPTPPWYSARRSASLRRTRKLVRFAKPGPRRRTARVRIATVRPRVPKVAPYSFGMRSDLPNVAPPIVAWRGGVVLRSRSLVNKAVVSNAVVNNAVVSNVIGGALLVAVFIGGAVGCGKTNNVSAGSDATTIGAGGAGAASPELTAQNERVIGALNEQEKACVQAEPDVAKAADNCVADATLGQSIAEIMGNSRTFDSMTDDDRKLLNACVPEALAALPAGSLGKLATEDKVTMDAFGKALEECGSRSRGGAAPSTTGPTIAQPPGTKGPRVTAQTLRPNTSPSTVVGNTPNNGVTSTSIGGLAVPGATAPAG